MADSVIEFRNAVARVFGPIELTPIGDGQIHRFRVPGDRAGTQNGWYALHADGVAFGVFGSWKTGGFHSWSSRKPADPLDCELLRVRMEQARRQREAEQCQRQQATVVQAARLWNQAVPADPRHPYLARKGVQPRGLRQLGDMLLVALYHNGQLANLQRIYPDGGKRFLPGGRVNGCYSPVGALLPGLPLYLCEGWATGATLHEATGAPVACAMNAGNLLQAGLELSRRFQDAVLVVAGDDDRQTEGNPGRTAATKAAAMLGCGLVFPAWPEGAPLTLTDFNDLSLWREGRV
ncbi:toprim domain-containing protein [Pseudomonas sp. NPDC047961]